MHGFHLPGVIRLHGRCMKMHSRRHVYQFEIATVLCLCPPMFVLGSAVPAPHPSVLTGSLPPLSRRPTPTRYFLIILRRTVQTDWWCNLHMTKTQKENWDVRRLTKMPKVVLKWLWRASACVRKLYISSGFHEVTELRRGKARERWGRRRRRSVPNERELCQIQLGR